MFKIGAFVDNLLNSITMYRLVLYVLCFLAALSLVFGFLKIIPYNPLQLVGSLVVLTATGVFFNVFFSKLFKAPTNVESVYITSFILYFLILPPENIVGIWVLALAALIANASKYLIAYHHKHIFNPAAIASVVLGAIGIGQGLWWIGTSSFLPATLIGGLLIVRKIRKFKLFFTFLFVATLTAFTFGVAKGAQIREVIEFLYTSGPIIFFATVMLTEPSTTPPTAKKQLVYGALVGLFYGSQFRIGPIFSSPEVALVLGNIYSYIVSSKDKLLLTLSYQKQIARDTYEFAFKSDRKLNYVPGQYLEWTLPHKKSDSRGVRRYFTVASSPTEADLKLGIKFNPNPSSFKKKLLSLKPGEKLSAGQLAGDFLLPKDTNKKLAFIAGGIGITPFRSMVENLMDTNTSRPIVLLYSNKTDDEVAYRDILEKASKNGVKTVYVLTDEKNVPSGFKGEVGRLNDSIIKKYVPDFKERIFYLSGPNAMVHAYKEMLFKMGATNIVTDYFPGL